MKLAAKTVREVQRGLALRCETIVCVRSRMDMPGQQKLYEKIYYGDAASDEASAIARFLNGDEEFGNLLDYDEETGKHRLKPSVSGCPDRVIVIGKDITEEVLVKVNPGKPSGAKNRIDGRNLLTKGRNEALRNCKKAVSCAQKLDDIVEIWKPDGTIEKCHSGKNDANFLAAVDSLMYGLLAGKSKVIDVLFCIALCLFLHLFMRAHSHAIFLFLLLRSTDGHERRGCR